MKLSEKMMRGHSAETFGVSGRIVNSADRRIAASVVHGTGQCAIVSPGGMMYLPAAQDEAVVAAGDTESLCLGIKMMDNPYRIEPGEIVLFSRGGASVILKNDGSIHLNGTIYINDHEWEGS